MHFIRVTDARDGRETYINGTTIRSLTAAVGGGTGVQLEGNVSLDVAEPLAELLAQLEGSPTPAPAAR